MSDHESAIFRAGFLAGAGWQGQEQRRRNQPAYTGDIITDAETRQAAERALELYDLEKQRAAA